MTPQRIFYLQTLQKSPIFENSLIFKETQTWEIVEEKYVTWLLVLETRTWACCLYSFYFFNFLKGLEAVVEAAEVEKGGKERKKIS